MKGDCCAKLLTIILINVKELSLNKFSSNVIEKCILYPDLVKFFLYFNYYFEIIFIFKFNFILKKRMLEEDLLKKFQKMKS